MPNATEFGTQREADCLELIKILGRISEAIKGQTMKDRRLVFAETLAGKFIFQAITVLYLCRKTRLPEMDAVFVDFPSINIITRACFESMLTFYYLFLSPKDEAERCLRLDAWELVDLTARQAFEAVTDDARRQLVKDKERIGALRGRIFLNPHLSALKPRIREDFLDGRKWRSISWSKIAAEIGISKTHGETYYNFLCSYAHSGYLSAFQLLQSAGNNSDPVLRASTVGALTIAAVHLIDLYCQLFPECRLSLEGVPAEHRRVCFWLEVDAGFDVESGGVERAG